MPNYRADSDINAIFEERLRIPDGLDPAEVGRLEQFLRCDKVLEEFYKRSASTERPPENDLAAAAATAMTAYDQRSDHLPVGWQKFLVLQAGIAGSYDNLDSSEVQDWAYTRIKEENSDWLGDFDDDIDREMPLRWLTQLIGVGVLRRRQLMEEPMPPPKKRWFGR